MFSFDIEQLGIIHKFCTVKGGEAVCRERTLDSGAPTYILLLGVKPVEDFSFSECHGEEAPPQRQMCF